MQRTSRQLWLTLGAASLVGVALFLIGVLRNQSIDYWYLPYNLALGVIPLLLSTWLVKLLRTRRWKNWLTVAVTGLWLLFLPNSFYIVTDFIHVVEYSRVDLVQDVVMLMQFSVVGLLLGFLSLYQVHKELLKRLSLKKAHLVILAVLLLSSFAVYVGRDLRWNSWDVVTQPVGLFGDILVRLVHPFAYPEMWSIMLSFFVMLSSLYLVGWQTRRLRGL